MKRCISHIEFRILFGFLLLNNINSGSSSGMQYTWTAFNLQYN